jgi:U3 small nucleolar RNA-associated protein 13
MSTLKRSSDGLSKSWAVNGSVKPFFSGGRVEISEDPSTLYCVHDGSLSSLDLKTSAITTNVLGDKTADAGLDDDDMRDGITCFCVHPDGHELVVATASYLLKHYNVQTGALLRTVRGNYNMPILCMAYDSSGTLVATGSTDCVVRVWDIGKGYCTHTFRVHSDTIPLVTFPSWAAGVGSPASDLLLCSCSDDRSIQLHDLQNSSTKAAFRQHMGTPTDVAFNNRWADSTQSTLLMASCGRDRVLNLFCMRTLSHLKTVPVAEEELETLVFIGGGAASSGSRKGAKDKGVEQREEYRLATGGASGLLKLFTVGVTAGAVDCVLSLQIDAQQGCMLTNLVFLPQEEKLVAVTAEQCFHFFSVHSQPKGGSAGALQYDHVQIDGNLDDVLDTLMLTGSCVASSAQGGDEGEEVAAALPAYKLAVITNTSNLRIVNSSFQTVQHLGGHQDTIMALDCDNEW